MTAITELTDLHAWLEGLRLENYADVFYQQGWIGDKLLELTREDLADLGVAKEQRGLIMVAVEALRQGDAWPRLSSQEAPSYARYLTPDVEVRCCQLAQTPPSPWVPEVMEQWPEPIAHEYWRFRELLAEAQVVSAILQLKDLAEVLVKFPALVLTRDLIEHGSHEHCRVLRLSLLGGPLNLGQWLAQLRDSILAPLKNQSLPDTLISKPLLAFYLSQDGKNWLDLLGRLVVRRNDNIGHGAFHLDLGEYLTELSELIGLLNTALARQASNGFWQQTCLRTETGASLQGSQSIHHWHDSETLPHPQHQTIPLFLHYRE